MIFKKLILHISGDIVSYMHGIFFRYDFENYWTKEIVSYQLYCHITGSLHFFL